MKTTIAQKCSEGNIRTSEHTEAKASEKSEDGPYRRRNFAVTFWCKEEPIFDEKWMVYLAYSAEITPTTKRHHWQAFLYTRHQHSESAVAVWFMKNQPQHIEPGLKIAFMRGDFRSNETYCSKEGQLIEHGERPSQGQRRDLIALRDRISKGECTDNICWENPYMYHQYGRTLEKLENINLLKRKRTEMTIGTWFWGPTGVGKSQKAMEMVGNRTYYMYKDDKEWWDAYTGQEVVILNDFRGSIKFSELLQMIDKWDYSVSRREKVPIPFTSTEVIITSSKQPQDVYNNLEAESIDQLLRRVKVIELTHWKKRRGVP